MLHTLGQGHQPLHWQHTLVMVERQFKSIHSRNNKMANTGILKNFLPFGEWIHIYRWLTPFAETIPTLLTGYSPI